MSKIKRIYDFFFHANVIKTIIFNFRMLPFRQAIRLPIHLFGKVDIYNSVKKGNIVFEISKKPHFGGWKIGSSDDRRFNYRNPPFVTRLNINGTLVLGDYGLLRNGCIITISERASLILHTGVFMNINCKVFCESKIEIGEGTFAAWESQLMDSDFHYILQTDKFVKRITKPIVIGKNCWIGNRVTINKGVQIGDGCIIANNSVVNKKFVKVERCLIGGIPAKVLKNDVVMLHDYLLENKLNQYFASETNQEIVNTSLL